MPTSKIRVNRKGRWRRQPREGDWVYKKWIHLDTDDDAMARGITIGQQVHVRKNHPALRIFAEKGTPDKLFHEGQKQLHVER